MIKLYHNPRCSKSRAAKELLENRGVVFEIVEYLKTPLDAAALQALFEACDDTLESFLRLGEGRAKELGLSLEMSKEEIFEMVAKEPILMQRPIVQRDNKAAIGRPLEKIEQLLKGV